MIEETEAPEAKEDAVEVKLDDQPELSAEAKNAEDEYLKYMMGESKPE